MPLLLVAIACVISSHAALAQETRNAIYGEIAGSGVIPTFNYERRLNERWFGRVGLGVAIGYTENDNGSDTDTSFTIPLTVSHVNRPGAGISFGYAW